MFYTLRIIIVIITSHQNITQSLYNVGTMSCLADDGCVTYVPAADLALFLCSRSLLQTLSTYNVGLRLRGSTLHKSREEGREGGRVRGRVDKREGGREDKREGEREGGRVRGREEKREGGREGG